MGGTQTVLLLRLPMHDTENAVGIDWSHKQIRVSRQIHKGAIWDDGDPLTVSYHWNDLSLRSASGKRQTRLVIKG